MMQGGEAGGAPSGDAAALAMAIVLVLLAFTSLQAPSVAPPTGQTSPTRQAPAVTIELVLDQAPSAQVTVNGYSAAARYWDRDGYHLVFAVPSNGTYVLRPACCPGQSYLAPGRRYYAYWLGSCVAIRTDR